MDDLWIWNMRPDGVVYDSQGRWIDGYGYRIGSSGDAYTMKRVRRGVLYIMPGGIPGISDTGGEAEPAGATASSSGTVAPDQEADTEAVPAEELAPGSEKEGA